MAAVALQSVECVHGLQLDSVQLKQFKHKQDEPAKDLHCAARKVVRLGTTVLELEAATEMKKKAVIMLAQLGHMFVTNLKIISSNHSNLEREVTIMQCLDESLHSFKVTTVYCCNWDVLPIAAMGLISTAASGLISHAASGFVCLVASGVFCLAALGLISLAPKMGCSAWLPKGCFQFGSPVRGCSSLAAQNEDIAAWLPQERIFQLCCPEQDLQLGSQKRTCSFALQNFKLWIKFRRREAQTFFCSWECYS